MKQEMFKNMAFLLVDPYNDFLSEGGKLWPLTQKTVVNVNLVAQLKTLLEESRKHDVQVIFVPHKQSTSADYLNWKYLSPTQQGSKKYMLFEKGSWGGEFHNELVPIQGDIVAQNHWGGSGFAGTDLDLILRMRHIDHLVIAGMRANTCIDTTARYAVELGYHVTLISDAVAGFNNEEIDATVRINFPSYGHAVTTVAEFVATLSMGSK